jgi:hypothetical protein
MGSNPILAATDQRKRGDWAPVARRSGGALVPYAPWFLPFFYHQHAGLHRSSPDQGAPRGGSPLTPDYVVKVRTSAGQPLGQRMHIHPQRQRTTVGVAKLRGDIRGRHARGGQKRRGRVPQRVHMHALWQAQAVDKDAKHRGGAVRPVRPAVRPAHDQRLGGVVLPAEGQALADLLGPQTA